MSRINLLRRCPQRRKPMVQSLIRRWGQRRYNLSSIVAVVCLIAITSCSSSSDPAVPDNNNNDDKTPISFSVYSADFADTRAASATGAASTRSVAGNLGIEDLRNTGFGVFAYYTQTNSYTAGTYAPDFMYNQKVVGKEGTTAWTYDPLKYWPNTTNGRDQYVSFFAYAPYQQNGDQASLLSLSSNTYKGDPTVTYTLSTTGDNVDLLWGSNSDGTALTDLTRSTINSNIRFYFRHALTKIGGTKDDADKDAGLTVVLDTVNGNIAGGDNALSSTKVTLRNIRIEQIGVQDTATKTVTLSPYTSGTLNLNTGKWSNFTQTAVDTTGRKSSPYRHLIVVADSVKSKDAQGSINPILADPTLDKYTTDMRLPSGKRLAWDSIPQGVTTTPQNVYTTEYAPMLVLPVPGYKPVMRLTVEYVIRTYDPWLFAGHSDLRETLTRTFTLNEVPQQAHRYHITIHLGVHQIHLDGNLEEWLVSHGTIIHDKTTGQDYQGPDINEDDPSGDDHHWLAKRRKNFVR